MAHRLVEEAVEAKLRAAFTRCPIHVGNTVASPPADGSPFVLLQFPVAQDERFALGSRYHRQEGGFRIVLHLPVGTGMETFREWGEELCAIFRGVRFDGVQCVAPQPPFVNDETEGPYVWASIIVPFSFNYAA